MKLCLATALALIGFHTLNANALVVEKIAVPESVNSTLKSFEPSAILYLEDLNTFLISSDDTNKKDEPLLFFMNDSGQVESPVSRIAGISKMTDIESISQDENGTLYFLSSLGLNKNGKNKDERNMLVRASRSGKKINSTDSVLLRPLLLEALKNAQSKNLKSMRGDFEQELDVESHFTRQGEMYLGLKDPQPKPGTAVIVNIGNVEDVLSKSKLNLKEWKTIDFAAVSGEPDRLSDILPVSGKFLLTTTQENGPGRLWQLDEATDKLTLLEEFTDLHPEGVAYKPSLNSSMIVFDEGGSEGFFALRRF